MLPCGVVIIGGCNGLASAVIKTLESAIKELDMDNKITIYKMLQNYAIIARNKMGSKQN